MAVDKKEYVPMATIWYKLADTIWKVAKGVWSAIVITILVGVVIAILSLEQSKVPQIVLTYVITWFHPPFGAIQLVILIAAVVLTLIALASGIFLFIHNSKEAAPGPPKEVQAILDYINQDIQATKQREEVQQARDKEALTQYLHSIKERCETIRLRRFAHFSRALVFAGAPLNETFVHLQVVSDKPIYDAPCEQQRRYEAMRRRTDLSMEERDAYIQRLEIIWQSQLGPDKRQTPQPLPLEEVLSQLTATNPVAILLGTPGSGKTTFLRWLALHMAQASLSPNTYALPDGLRHAQVPILIKTKHYAGGSVKNLLHLNNSSFHTGAGSIPVWRRNCSMNWHRVAASSCSMDWTRAPLATCMDALQQVFTSS